MISIRRPVQARFGSSIDRQRKDAKVNLWFQRGSI